MTEKETKEELLKGFIEKEFSSINPEESFDHTLLIMGEKIGDLADENEQDDNEIGSEVCLSMTIPSIILGGLQKVSQKDTSKSTHALFKATIEALGEKIKEMIEDKMKVDGVAILFKASGTKIKVKEAQEYFGLSSIPETHEKLCSLTNQELKELVHKLKKLKKGSKIISEGVLVFKSFDNDGNNIEDWEMSVYKVEGNQMKVNEKGEIENDLTVEQEIYESDTELTTSDGMSEEIIKMGKKLYNILHE